MEPATPSHRLAHAPLLLLLLTVTLLTTARATLSQDSLEMNVGVGGVGGLGGTGATGGDGTSGGNVGNNSMTSVRPGQPAKLACPVPSGLYGTRVSWMRRRDMQLLAVGEKIYTPDSRFFVTHSRHVQVWFLHVRNVTKEDEGEYECQTSTHPHVSLLMFLKVSRTYSKILGASERVVASGSVLSLTCSLKNFTTQPEYVFWFQGDKMINFDTGRNVQVTSDRDFSTLTISNVNDSHAGNYTCDPANGEPDSVVVHVVVESNHNDGSSGSRSESSASGEGKLGEKPPVRQLGVKSPSSGISTRQGPLTLLGLLMLTLAFTFEEQVWS